MTSLLPGFKNGDADSRLGDLLRPWWMSGEHILARCVVMPEVLLERM